MATESTKKGRAARHAKMGEKPKRLARMAREGGGTVAAQMGRARRMGQSGSTNPKVD